ncbi:MAG: glycoside hydrolase family 28 protein [Phycisphaerae bacterium]
MRVLMAAVVGLALTGAVRGATTKAITEFGATGDGKTMNTEAIQKGIDELAGNGGGTLTVPEGTFLTGAIFLKPGVNLEIEKGGVLKGSTDTKDYPTMKTRIEGHFQDWLPALVNAEKCDHLKISGEGTIDGSGEPFWKAFRDAHGKDRSVKNLDVPRPRMMFIRDSDDVTVSGLHFLNSGFWNLHLYRDTHVTVDGLDIKAGDGSPSTDGVDVDSCQNVTIQNTTIYNNDDGICLKGSKGPLAMEDKDSPPVEHIRVTGCTILKSGSLVTCGSEATIVRDVVVENCKITGPKTRGTSVLRLKFRTDTPELYEDIHIKGVELDGVGQIVSWLPWSQYFDLQGHEPPKRVTRNITISDVKGTFGSFGTIRPGKGDTVEDVTFENIDLKVTNGEKGMPNVQGVKNLVVKNVVIDGKAWDGPGEGR